MKPFARSFLLLALGAVMLVVGCRRKMAIEPVPAASGDAPMVEPVAPAPQPGQPPPAIVSTRETKDTAYAQEMAQTLNDFLGDYIKQHKRIPRDINEMMSLKIITSVPVLPNGKQWVIDQRTGKISAR